MVELQYDVNGNGNFRIEGFVTNQGPMSIDTWHGTRMSITDPNGQKPLSDNSVGCYNANIMPGDRCPIDANIPIESDFAIGTWSYTMVQLILTMIGLKQMKTTMFTLELLRL